MIYSAKTDARQGARNRSDPNTPLERTREPVDRFTVAVVALMLAITLATVGFAFSPAGSSADPRADAPLAHAVEPGARRDSPQ